MPDLRDAPKGGILACLLRDARMHLLESRPVRPYLQMMRCKEDFPQERKQPAGQCHQCNHEQPLRRLAANGVSDA